jgi:hypothetical protein|tara:strand:- start:421 stop:771 length:351 start_codon:yes stop_codon:yes gene_type:complete
LAEIRKKLNWRRISVSIFMTLAIAINVFAIIPSAESHEAIESVSHIMVSAADDLSKSHETDRHNHIEKCGMISCAFSLPANFQVISTAFGAKTPFCVIAVQVASISFAPPKHPPKI